MLAIVSPLLLPSHSYFHVTHHVTLDRGVLTSHEARRDGTLVGSFGYENTNEGEEAPFIVLRGKVIRIKNADKLQFWQVAAILPHAQFELTGDGKKPTRAALRSNQLILGGRMREVPAQRELPCAASDPDKAIVSLFPIAENMRDNTSINKVYWYDLRRRLKLGQVQINWSMESGWKAVLREQTGRTLPLARYVRGLSGYTVRGARFVSPQGWLVVDAVKGTDTTSDGIDLGFGNELFWIEPGG